MPGKKRFAGLTLGVAFLTLTVLLGYRCATAQTATLIHSFVNGSAQGSNSQGRLVFDAHGNLYGTTAWGGTGTNCDGWPCGTVFELSPKPGGGWAEMALYSFGSSTGDGVYPLGGLVFDAAGNLYGTTNEGGVYGAGTVFELSPAGGGRWTEKVLHSFGNGTDGAHTLSNLVIDAAGNLYGTTSAGGDFTGGTVFEVSPGGGGNWTEKVLHNFGAGRDGNNLWAGVILDAAGNLYGTTYGGGMHGGGVVYELTPDAEGNWTENILYNFGAYARDGINPKGEVMFDAAGNLLGTTSSGGTVRGQNLACAPTCGTVFKLSPTAQGEWSESIVHIFGTSIADGNYPTAGLLMDAAGKLYGTTSSGGRFYNGGTVFELAPPTAGGAWSETVLNSFGRTASTPFAGVISDAQGNLYGTTYGGGIDGNGGTVFEVKP